MISCSLTEATARVDEKAAGKPSAPLSGSSARP